MGDGNLDIAKMAKEIALGQATIRYDILTMSYMFIDHEGNRMMISQDDYLKLVAGCV